MKVRRNTVFFLLIGTLVGFVLKTPTTGSSDKSNSVPPVAAALKHTCSMHPQIVMDHPDICPLCGMDLTPVQSGGGGWEDEDPASRLVLSPAARKMADVGSVEVRECALFKEIRTVGKVELDETCASQASPLESVVPRGRFTPMFPERESPRERCLSAFAAPRCSLPNNSF